MAIEVSASIATQLNLGGSVAVRQLSGATALSRSARTPSLAPPEALDASLSRRQGVRLSVEQAQKAVRVAIASGESIIFRLRDLESRYSAAINEGVVSPRTSLLDGEGTRVSRLVINTKAGRILDAIDRQVRRSEVNGANLISSNEGKVTIQTTSFGGRITVRAQPLDTKALGLEDVNALSQQNSVAARAKVANAITLASDRLEHLRALRKSLEFRGVTPQAIVRFQNNALFEKTVRGGLVDLTA